MCELAFSTAAVPPARSAGAANAGLSARRLLLLVLHVGLSSRATLLISSAKPTSAAQYVSAGNSACHDYPALDRQEFFHKRRALPLRMQAPEQILQQQAWKKKGDGGPECNLENAQKSRVIKFSLQCIKTGFRLTRFFQVYRSHEKLIGRRDAGIHEHVSPSLFATLIPRIAKFIFVRTIRSTSFHLRRCGNMVMRVCSDMSLPSGDSFGVGTLAPAIMRIRQQRIAHTNQTERR